MAIKGKRGGHGEKASTVESKQHDEVVKMISMSIAKALHIKKDHTLFFEEGYRNTGKTETRLPELAEIGFSQGCIPDGGMWFTGNRSVKNRTLVAVFEAKKQGKGGNAIERWWKNWAACTRIFKDVKYITFLTGPGAQTGEILAKHANDALVVAGAESHLKVEPFTNEEVFEVMKTALGLTLNFADIEPYIECKKNLAKFRKENNK